MTDTSLSCILPSYIIEKVFEYRIFRVKKIKDFFDRLPYFLFTVTSTLAGSIIMGLFTHNISVLTVKVEGYLFNKSKKLYKDFLKFI